MDVAEIRKALGKSGKTQRGLADAMGVDATAVSRLLKGARKLRLDEVPKVEAYLNAMSPETTRKFEPNSPFNRYKSDIGSMRGAPAEGAQASRLPVLGMAECGPDGWSLWNGDVVDTVPMPANLLGVQKAYAVYINGSSMEPRYEAGMVAHIHPHKPPTIGSYVLIQRKPNGPGEPPLAVIKRLERRSGSKVTVSQFNPPKTFDIKTDDIISMHRVVGSAEA